MTKQMRATLKDFSPAPDALVEEYDLLTAIVWGRVWRYCQLSDGFCRASKPTIASDLGISDRQVRRCMSKLVDAGYFREERRPGKPSRYFDTGKMSLEMGIGVVSAPRTHSQATPDSESGVPWTQSPPTPDSESAKDTEEETEVEETEEETTTGGSAAAAVVVLQEIGMDPKVAQTLAANHSLERIQAWIEEGERKAEDLPAYVRRALERGWQLPLTTEEKLAKAFGLDSGESRRRYVEGEYADHIEH